jgi:hypothetical protein
MCKLHAARFRRHGDPLVGRTKNGETWAFIQLARAHAGEDCLFWPFATVNGYASMRKNGETINVCRMLCMEAHGEPEGDRNETCHSCGNGRNGCISLRHLRWGTRQENVQDMVDHGHSRRGTKQRPITAEEKERQRAGQIKAWERRRQVNAASN